MGIYLHGFCALIRIKQEEVVSEVKFMDMVILRDLLRRALRT